MGQLPFRENLEQFNNPEEVRRSLAEGKYRPPFDGIAQSYLASVDRAVSDKSEALRAAHDEAMLACAKEANDIARAAIDSQSATKNIKQEKAEPAPDHWYKKPIGVIGIAVASGVLLALALSLLK